MGCEWGFFSWREGVWMGKCGGRDWGGIGGLFGGWNGMRRVSTHIKWICTYVLTEDLPLIFLDKCRNRNPCTKCDFLFLPFFSMYFFFVFCSPSPSIIFNSFDCFIRMIPNEPSRLLSRDSPASHVFFYPLEKKNFTRLRPQSHERIPQRRADLFPWAPSL